MKTQSPRVLKTSGTRISLLSAPEVDMSLSELIEGISGGSPNVAAEELYRRFRSFRFFFYRQLRNNEADDCYHDLIMKLLDGIRRGLIREPERVQGYANTIAHRIVAARIRSLCAERQNLRVQDLPRIPDGSPGPESQAIETEQRAIAARILNSLGVRDRELLVRFYLDQESAEQIQKECGLSETQFRLIKSRAKARFSELLKRRMGWNPGWRFPSSSQLSPIGVGNGRHAISVQC